MSFKIKRSKKNSFFTTFDKLMYVIAFLGPLLTVPQVIQIFSTHSAAGVSIVTWLGYQVLTIMWVIYGVGRKDVPLILTEVLWFTVQALVIVGIFLYS